MDFLLFITIIIILLCVIRLYSKATNGICKSRKRLDGKTCVITGGTTGIGLEIALDLAKRGARIILACPFQFEGESAREKIVKESNNFNVEFQLLNLASFKSVREFAANINRQEQRLDILINNAGVVKTETTEDALNSTMQVNYYGHFLLTIMLLPLLKKTGTKSEPSRIVNTNSSFHRVALFNKFERNNLLQYDIRRVVVYGNSKLCLLLFSRELSKRLESNVVINDADPGAVGTNLHSNSTFITGFFFKWFFYIFAKTPSEGAQTPLHVALDQKAGEVSSKFFKECKISTPSKAACDDVTARRLWDQSVERVKLSKDELDKCVSSNRNRVDHR